MNICSTLVYHIYSAFVGGRPSVVGRQSHASAIAAVDHQRRAGDVVGVVAGQEGGGAADVARGAHAAPRDVASGALDLLLGSKGALARCVDVAWVDHVDVDVVGRQLGGQRAPQMVDSC